FIGISSFILPRKFYFRIPLRSGGITPQVIRDTGKNRDYWFEARNTTGQQFARLLGLGQKCLTFGSELNDANCPFLEVLAAD
ncbi:hypothetical protein, partial [Phaeobacter sp. HF9A]|uniref:hypothetical protein n=1 Tax=Phaeobacter sp. HF9A TaxID=2721561 RepID=UPI001C37C15F